MHSMRVLIIDDIEEIHHNIRAIFHERSAQPLETLKQEIFGLHTHAVPLANHAQLIFDSAHQGQEGYNMIKASQECGQPYSVAIVDMRMPPGWDGLQTIRKIREIDQDIEIIICSAYSDYSWHDIAQELGVSDKYLFLTKPFEVTEMKQMVINLAEKWRLHAKNKVYVQELAVARSLAEASDRAKRDFLGIIGHELRTPLNVILMTVEDLLESQNDKAALQVIRNSHRSTLRLAQMIEGILVYTEMDNEHFSFKSEAFSLSELLRQCENQFRPLCTEKQLLLQLHVAPSVPAELIGDLPRTHQLLFQLLSNSLRFTAQGSLQLSVRLDAEFSQSLAPETAALEFNISDTGQGMNKTQLERCCQLFYQGEEFKHHSRTGIGLGLNLCKKIVSAMGGVLRIESELHKGTEVSVSLPFKVGALSARKNTA